MIASGGSFLLARKLHISCTRARLTRPPCKCEMCDNQLIGRPPDTYEKELIYTAEFATKGTAGAGLGLGIAGTALGVLNGGLGNILGGWGYNPAAAACSENMAVNRYELGQETKIAELQAQIALRDANVYNDQKLLEVYKYFDGKLEGVNQRLCEQAVWNATQTGAIGCMAAQINQLQGLTKIVIPNGSVCPGWGDVTVTPATTTTTT